ATFTFNHGRIEEELPFGQTNSYSIHKESRLVDALKDFATKFNGEPQEFKFISNGLFGYIQYDTLAYFEDINLQNTRESAVPMMQYSVYKNVIVVDHFKNELHIFEHSVSSEEETNSINQIETLLKNKNIPSYQFKLLGEETSNYSDEEFLDILRQGREHCF